MMRMLRQYVVAVTLVLIPLSGAEADQEIALSDKAALQAAMQRHIDRSLVDGAYLQMNSTSGVVRSLYPVKAHPLILQLGDFFVLCSDFRDGNGKAVNIDFYLAKRDRGYVVFHAAIDNRDLLRRLMKTGKIERVDY